MRFARRSKTHVGLEPIALTDIVMNLFLFFFITFNLLATFDHTQESPLAIDLPSVTSGPTVSHLPSHEIVLSKNGGIQWDRDHISIQELKEELLRGGVRKELIMLRADRGASVQSLTSILEVIRDTGATHVSLQTEVTQRAPSGS